jgi:hypothetical protein
VVSRLTKRAGFAPVLVALLAIAIAIVGACGSASPTLVPTPSTATSVPSPAITAGSDGAYHSAPKLEALLPDSVGGFRLTKGSQKGTDLQDPGRQFTDMLANLGRSLADFSVASGYARELKAEVGVWEIVGASEKDLVSEFTKAVQASSTTPLTVAETTVAGRPVTQIGVPGQLTKGPIYVYSKNGLLFFVETPEPDLAEAALTNLP